MDQFIGGGSIFSHTIIYTTLTDATRDPRTVRRVLAAWRRPWPRHLKQLEREFVDTWQKRRHHRLPSSDRFGTIYDGDQHLFELGRKAGDEAIEFLAK
jgi:hypothetical protein